MLSHYAESLNMEVVGSSEILVSIYKTTRFYNPKPQLESEWHVITTACELLLNALKSSRVISSAGRPNRINFQFIGDSLCFLPHTVAGYRHSGPYYIQSQ
jgi:hypothetical protein